MPFKSKAQMKKCFAMRGKSKGWDCEKWAKETPDKKSLPNRVGRAKPKK